MAAELREYLIGWSGYFQLAQTPKVLRELDEWIRHRIRAVQLKQWKRGRTTYRELRALGLSETGAKKVAVNTHRWWHTARILIHVALPTRSIDAMEVPRLGR